MEYTDVDEERKEVADDVVHKRLCVWYHIFSFNADAMMDTT